MKLKVGDKIRITGIPGEGQPKYLLSPETKRVYRKLIARNRLVRIFEIEIDQAAWKAVVRQRSFRIWSLPGPKKESGPVRPHGACPRGKVFSMPAALKISPLYTPDNCAFAYQLNWGLSVFWRADRPKDESWLAELREQLAGDQIRLLHHRFAGENTSQFALSTQPAMIPLDLIRLVKGRLQYAVRKQCPRALKRNYGLRSIGFVKRHVVERYVETQLERHRMADPRVQQMLEQFQFRSDNVDLSQLRKTSHGVFWYNLHVVLENADRLHDVTESGLRAGYEMILSVSKARDYLLSRAAVLSNHMHMTVGCPFDASPAAVALCYMNNLAFAREMNPFLRFGAYVGTFGEYDLGVLPRKTPSHGNKSRGDDWYREYLPT